jgi:hypothetical protein
MVKGKQEEMNNREAAYENKFMLLSEDQKQLFKSLLNTNKFDYATYNTINISGSNSQGNNNNNKSSSGNHSKNYKFINNQFDNIINKYYPNNDRHITNKNKKKVERDKHSTNNLLGEISFIFEKLKEENFFDKICETEINTSNNLTLMKLNDFNNQAGHLITDPISMQNNNPFSYKNTQNSDNTLKIIDKDLNKKNSNSIFDVNSANSSFAKKNYLVADKIKINLIYEKDYYEKEFLEDELFNSDAENYFLNKRNLEKDLSKNAFQNKNNKNDKKIKSKNKQKIFHKFYNQKQAFDEKLPNIPFILRYYSNLLINPYEEKDYFSDEIEYQKNKLGAYIKCNYPMEYYESVSKVDKILQRSSSNSNFYFKNNLNSRSNQSNNKFRNIIKNLEIVNSLKDINKNTNKIKSPYRSKELRSNGSSTENIRPKYRNDTSYLDGLENKEKINRINKMEVKRNSLKLTRISEVNSAKKKSKINKTIITKSASINIRSIETKKKIKESGSIINLVPVSIIKNNKSIINKKNQSKSKKNQKNIALKANNEVKIKRINDNINEYITVKKIDSPRSSNKGIKIEIQEPILTESKNFEKNSKNLIIKNKKNREIAFKNETENKSSSIKLNKNQLKTQVANVAKILKTSFIEIEEHYNDNANRERKINKQDKKINVFYQSLEDLDISEFNQVANTSSRIVTKNYKNAKLDFSMDNLLNTQNNNEIIITIPKEKSKNKTFSKNMFNIFNQNNNKNKSLIRNKSENLKNHNQNLLNVKENKINYDNFSRTYRKPFSKSVNSRKTVSFDLNNNDIHLKEIKNENNSKEKKAAFKNKEYFDKRSIQRNNLKKTFNENEDKVLSNNLNYTVIKFDNYAYVKSRYEYLNKLKKEKEDESSFDPKIHSIEMRINVTPVNSKKGRFGIKAIKKIKESETKKFVIDEFEDQKDKGMFKSRLFRNDSRKKSLMSKLFI